MKIYVKGQPKELNDTRIEQLYLSSTDTAIVTVDLHEGHLSNDPLCPCPAERGRGLISPVNAFTSACRKRGIPIIHVRSVLREDGSDDVLGNISAWRLLFPLTGVALPNADQHALQGSRWTEFSIDVEENDYVIDSKKRLSCFYPTDLELLLRNLHKRIVVLAGAMTDCCVLNTAFDAANRDFRVIVVKDLTIGDVDLEESALHIISSHLGLVLNSGELLQEWDRNDQSTH